MTLDEAIKTLAHSLPADTWLLKPPSKDAIKLGIEALKREQQRRKYLINSTGELLPGETHY